MDQMQTHNSKEKSTDPQPINGVLSSGHLHYLVRKARLLMSIDALLPTILPFEAAASHVNAMNITEDTLVIEVDNAAWATRLRYSESELLDKIQMKPALTHIKRILYRIRPKR